MIQFKKLRLNGFKSFVEKTELDIEPGLTGIVGPNGCGKSNLVEALRWAMGENSAKRMRGDGMDDVIFSGTSSRPSRSIAEVSILLDNETREAPPAWNGGDEVEVVRKIERDHGSSYKINGRPVRAKDVQLLFADTLSGANSPALVSQGRVTGVINAKPSERRLILEESAGISGLYARRHEAELRLRAADNNLVRIEDVLGSMEGRLAALKKQARQASRYRNISAQIRQLEVLIAWLEWRGLHERVEGARKRFSEAESRVAEHLETVTQLTKTQTTQSQDLPALRQAEAEAAAALQNRKIALQRLEDEETRLEQAIQETTDQIRQQDADRSHEKQSIEENSCVLERIDEEQKKIQSEQENEGDILESKRKIRDELEEKAQALETDYTTLMEGAAEVRARKQSLEHQLEQEQKRRESVRTRLGEAEKALQEKKEQLGRESKVGTIENAIRTIETDIENLRTQLEGQRTKRAKQAESVEIGDKTRREIEDKKSTLITEINTLKSFLESDNEKDFRPVLDDIQTDDGFEVALSKALGDTLMASTEEDAPVIWLERPAHTLPALPDDIRSLQKVVKAPKALQPALSQIGIIEDESQAQKLSERLLPGQSLVSPQGAYWRWDGLHIKASATDRHAVRLRQRNRLQELEASLPEMEAACSNAQESHRKSRQALDTLQSANDTLQSTLSEKERELLDAKSSLNEAVSAQSGLEADIARLEETVTMAGAELERLDKSIETCESELSGFDDNAMNRRYEKIEQMRGTLRETRDSLRDAIRAFDLCKQEQDSRKARLHGIADERLNLQNRSIRAREHMKMLDERQTQLAEKLNDLKKRPKTIKAEQEALLSKITEAEALRNKLADKLATCESELAETMRALKTAESELSTAREARAHAQATVSAGQEQMEEQNRAIREKFEMKPEELTSNITVNPDQEHDLESIRLTRDRLTRERDNIGPVNLRADVEAEELEKELTGLLNERNDLLEAIAELRQGIQKLNREARERLAAAFDHVNAHFRALFGKLYGGGAAHLALVDSEDPLEAGLEIFAQPPGKTLQSLSLLSGGEQTLASIALIFAMFLTNPSPICVLDEIDAPLDDANVDRVCDLLDEIVETGNTRFIIITHHRLTMARMDRLYGVTMAERGISQLVSVDLQQSFEFMEAAE